MRRIGIVAVLATLLMAFSASTALAVTNFDNAPQGAHYRQGFGEPVCTLTGTTVTCTGTQIGGVGNTNATVTLSVTASATILCRNPGNQNIVEPHTTEVTESTSQVVASTRNGRLIIPSLSESVTVPDVEQEFTCPNPNWTEEVTDITVTSFTYTVTFAGFTEPAILVTGP